MKKKKIDKRHKFQRGDKARIARGAMLCKNHKVGMAVTIITYWSWSGFYEVRNYRGEVGFYSANELNKT